MFVIKAVKLDYLKHLKKHSISGLQPTITIIVIDRRLKKTANIHIWEAATREFRDFCFKNDS